jgi:hypothetical protein
LSQSSQLRIKLSLKSWVQKFVPLSPATMQASDGANKS